MAIRGFYNMPHSESITLELNEDGTATILCVPSYVRYEFDSIDSALEALPCLDELPGCH